MKKAQLGNCFYRGALLQTICDSLNRFNMKKVEFGFSTYADKRDIPSFRHKFKKYVVQSVYLPDPSNGKLKLDIWKRDGKSWQTSQVVFDAWEFRCATLERITCEVYDWLKDADDKEFEDAVQANFEYIDTMYRA